jgi:hypothetical protein
MKRGVLGIWENGDPVGYALVTGLVSIPMYVVLAKCGGRTYLRGPFVGASPGERGDGS